MKILLGLLISFNAFAAEYDCTKDVGFLGIDYIASLFSGQPVDAPVTFEYPKHDDRPGYHQEQSVGVTASGGPGYVDSKGWVVLDVENVANTNDVTLKLVNFSDAEIFVCERTAVPYERCFPKKVFPNQSELGVKKTLEINMVGGNLWVPGVASDTLAAKTPKSFAGQAGVAPNSAGSQLYIVQNPPRTYEEVRFPNASGRSQKYKCKNKASNNAVSNGSLDPQMPMVIPEGASSNGATQQ
jgi:hypothetical protein